VIVLANVDRRSSAEPRSAAVIGGHEDHHERVRWAS
jgi:hypothetical protein